MSRCMCMCAKAVVRLFLRSNHGLRLRESAGMKTTDILRAEELAREHRPLIISKWHEHFD